MSTPFPGMDPYLERRGLWEGVHTRLLVALADAIAPKVHPRYRVDVEQRTYHAVMTPDELTAKPDVLVLATREPRVTGNGSRTDYRILVSRSHLRPPADAYRFGVRDAIPDIPVPLRDGEPEPILPLNQILHELNDRAGYDLAVDYRQLPVPPLALDDVDWAASLLAQHYTASTKLAS